MSVAFLLCIIFPMHSKHKKSPRKQDSLASILQGAGLRPTKQRLALSKWLFDGCHKHVTADDLHGALVKSKARVSLATVYNTLNNFTDAGLLRRVCMNGGLVYFDTNMGDHYHMFDEGKGLLSDIPASSINIAKLPKIPKGAKLSRVDVVVRIKS